VAKVDGVNELVDITNHAEGENPYYTEPVAQASSSGCGCSSGKGSGDSGCGC
jgi:hypothetical protein